jgi:molecular chaperone HtpG
MEGPLASHYINFLESKIENTSFVRVDSNTVDKLIEKEENTVSKLNEDEKKQLQPVIEAVVPKERFTVMFENMSEKDVPMVITQSEFMRRMKEMSAMGGGGGMNFYGSLPEMYNLVVNSNHPLVSKILAEKDATKQSELAKQAADLALLSQGLLKGDELTKFIKRSVSLIN